MNAIYPLPNGSGFLLLREAPGYAGEYIKSSTYG